MPKRPRRNDSDYLRFRPFRPIGAPLAGPYTAQSVAGRNRFLYVVLAFLVIGLGLFWRSKILPLPPVVAKFGGDLLWALMLFLGVGFIWPRLKTWSLAFIALAVSFLVECTQLYHAPWIDDLRAYPLGSLILGTTFNWPDFGAYTAGVLLGVLLDRLLARYTLPS